MQRSLVNFMTHSKKCGEDSLIQIYAVPSVHQEIPEDLFGISSKLIQDGCDTREVVRWCYKCGAVVVDIDYDNRNDNRTSPGAVMKMRFPENRMK